MYSTVPCNLASACVPCSSDNRVEYVQCPTYIMQNALQIEANIDDYEHGQVFSDQRGTLISAESREKGDMTWLERLMHF